MDKRGRCTEEALRLFVRRGFRAVTIGELTQRLNVSSKTIYQLFGDKQSLARAAVALYQTRSEAILDQLWAETADPAELLVRVYLEQIDRLSGFHPSFFQEAPLFLPADQSVAGFFGCARSEDLLRRGQQVGLFHTRVQPRIAAETLTLLLEQCVMGERFAGQGTRDLMQQVLWPYLRGLCTEAGLVAFRRYRLRYLAADAR